MKNLLSLILLLTTATLACGQGKLLFDVNTDNIIYFTTNTSLLDPNDAQATFDSAADGGPFPIAGSSAFTGPALDGVSLGSIQALSGSPQFVVALYGGTSAGSLSLQTTTTIDSWASSNPGGIVAVNCDFASLPAGVPAYFQVQVYDSRDADANASIDAGHYYGTSQIFQATPQASIYNPVWQTSAPVNSTWTPGTFDPTDIVALFGPGFCYGGIEVSSIAQEHFYYFTNNGTLTIAGYYGPSGAVTIPSMINALPVTSLGDDAFYDCYSVTSVSIPHSVTSIGANVFGSCFALSAITVDAANPAYTSEDGVLFGKDEVMLIQYPQAKTGTSYTIPNSVIGIGQWAFYHCTSLTNITIPSRVSNIGDSAFYECTSLTSITIPSSVTSIGDNAFVSCTSLTNIIIPNSVISIRDGAFGSCTSLSSVTIGTNVISIGYEAFYDCWSLASITIPSSVTSIGDYAFVSCTSLSSVYFKGNAPSVDSSVFAGDNNATAYYLPGSTGWNPQVQTSDASFGLRTNQFGFNIRGTSGLGVMVDACTNLANPTWVPVSTNTLTSGSSYFSDSQWTNYTQRFYRLGAATLGGCPVVLWNPLVQTTDDSFGVRSNRFGFNITGTPNIPIIVAACTNLASPIWFPLKSCTLTNGSVYFSDSQWTNYPGRYYRLRSP